MPGSWVPIDDILTRVEARTQDCVDIAERARSHGLSVTWSDVNRNYKVWKRWDMGLLSLGYVMRQTGARRSDDG